jgi:hypothetical protein
MATGQVSSITSDNWQLIATNTTTSGTTSSFSFSGYKRLLLTWNVNTAASSNIYFLLNGATTNYGGGTWVNEYNGQFNVSNTAIYINGIVQSGNKDGYCIIENAAAGAPKLVNGFDNENGYVSTIASSWNNTAALTSLAITTSSAFNAGSISLYGIAA